MRKEGAWWFIVTKGMLEEGIKMVALFSSDNSLDALIDVFKES